MLSTPLRSIKQALHNEAVGAWVASSVVGFPVGVPLDPEGPVTGCPSCLACRFASAQGCPSIATIATVIITISTCATFIVSVTAVTTLMMFTIVSIVSAASRLLLCALVLLNVLLCVLCIGLIFSNCGMPEWSTSQSPAQDPKTGLGPFACNITWMGQVLQLP